MVPWPLEECGVNSISNAPRSDRMPITCKSTIRGRSREEGDWLGITACWDLTTMERGLPTLIFSWKSFSAKHSCCWMELVRLQIRGMAWTWNVGAGASGTQESSVRARARVVARVATSPVCGGQITWLPTSGASLVGPVGLKS